jgi:intracellular sulfur oxidation DsrE/DsrF family protein
MIKNILLFLVMVSSLYSQMEFSDKKPTFDDPRLWIVKLNTNDIDKVNHIIDNINNVLKIYPSKALDVTVVVYSSGMRVLKKDYDKNTLLRIKSLMEYDVEFIGCKNTMETMGWKEDDFIEDINYVQAGIAQILERVASGWIELTPY